MAKPTQGRKRAVSSRKAFVPEGSLFGKVSGASVAASAEGAGAEAGAARAREDEEEITSI